MMTMLRKFIAPLLATLFLAPEPASAQARFPQHELDRLLAPVALYPDPLLSQVLMAATYPADVVEAARWSRANPHLAGDDAVRAADHEDWDPSVKSLLAFPHLLQRMDEKPDWTRALGEAFLAQEPQVMETVQQLRRRAHATGHLRTDDRILVQPQGPAIAIVPAQPHVVYVPYYDPLVVYGPWWWPAFRPVYWAPWPGYVRVHRPGVSVAFWWGAPVRLSSGFFFGSLDWHHRQVRVVHVHNHYVHAHRHVHLAPGHWRHAPHRERVVEQRVTEHRVIRRPMVERRMLERPAPERPREPVRAQGPQVRAQPIQAPGPEARRPDVQRPALHREGFRHPGSQRHDALRARPHAGPRRDHAPAPRGQPRGEARNERPRRGGERS